MKGRAGLRWWLVLGAALVASALVAGGIAQAAAKKHTIKGTVILAQYASSGTTTKDAGIATGKPGGTAAVLQNNSATSTGFNAKGTVYGKAGTYTYKATGTFTGQPDGSVSVAGTGKITGGTGLYRHAKGKFNVTGSIPKDSTIATLKVTGSITY